MICAVVGDWLFRYCRHRATKVAAIYVYLVCLAPALLHWLELFHGTMLMLLPLLGKSGTIVPPDIVGIINSLHSLHSHLTSRPLSRNICGVLHICLLSVRLGPLHKAIL